MNFRLCACTFTRGGLEGFGLGLDLEGSGLGLGLEASGLDNKPGAIQ